MGPGAFRTRRHFYDPKPTESFLVHDKKIRRSYSHAPSPTQLWMRWHGHQPSAEPEYQHGEDETPRISPRGRPEPPGSSAIATAPIDDGELGHLVPARPREHAEALGAAAAASKQVRASHPPIRSCPVAAFAAHGPFAPQAGAGPGGQPSGDAGPTPGHVCDERQVCDAQALDDAEGIEGPQAWGVHPAWAQDASERDH